VHLEDGERAVALDGEAAALGQNAGEELAPARGGGVELREGLLGALAGDGGEDGEGGGADEGEAKAVCFRFLRREKEEEEGE